MQLHKAMTYNPRGDFIVETVQMVSGLLLVLFLYVHMIFVASIWLGKGSFNALAGFMDKFGLLPLTIVFLVLVFAMHIGAVLRRVPKMWAEQKTVWKHAKLIHHTDTWSWVFQSITGGAILGIAAVHISVVAFAGINARLSSLRVHNPGFLIMYGALLLLAEYHASVGLYRIFVKWGFMNRHSMKRVLEVISLLLIAASIITLVIFYKLGA